MKTNELSEIRHGIVVNMPYALLHFLIEEEALNLYLNRMVLKTALNEGSRFFKFWAPHQYIAAGFTWKTTAEGHGYWYDLHKKWNQVINNKHFQKVIKTMKTDRLSKTRHYIVVNMSYDLLHFLIEEKAFKPFVANKAKTKDRFYNSAPYNYIVGAFSWRATSEGYEYWCDLHEKWDQIIYNKHS